jgi:hypothetical protein
VSITKRLERSVKREPADPFWEAETGLDLYASSKAASGGDGSYSAPFATIADLQTAALAFGHGVKIGLFRGSVWREQLTLTTLNNVTVRGVGDKSLPLPCLDARDIASSAGWTKTAGQTNVYERSWSHSVPAISPMDKQKISVMENGQWVKWVSSIELCNAEPGTFFIRNDQLTNPSLIYIHPAGSTDPASNGRTYHITARNYGLTVGSGYRVKDVWTIGQAHHDGSFVGGVNGYGENILSSYGVVHNQWVSMGSRHVGCVAYKCHPATWRPSLNNTLFVTYNATGGVGAYYENCYSYYDELGAGSAGFYTHSNSDSTPVTRVEYHNCKAYGGSSFSAANTQRLVMDGCWSEGKTDTTIAQFLASVAAIGKIEVYNSTLYNCTRAISFGGTIESRVENCRFMQQLASSGGLFWGSNASISNCSIWINPSLPANNANVWQNDEYTNIKFNSNAVRYHGFRAIRVATAGDIESSGNVLSNANFRIGATSYTTLAAWQAATGQDANSVIADPGFGDPTNNDWSLLGTSAANTGGRQAGSRTGVERPNWAFLTAKWEAGFIGHDL